MSTPREIDEATEAFLDAFLVLVEGMDDGELVFIEHHLRAAAERLGIAATWPEIEPMTAGEFRRRWRASKTALANGEGPGRVNRASSEGTET